MEKFLDKKIDLKTMSALALAFTGDAVYEVFVREYLVLKGNSNVKKLHSKSVQFVRCQFQAKMINEVLMPILSEEETDAYMRGRNAKVGHVPKNASSADYHNATGFEAVFGYIYLKGDLERLNELFSLIAQKWEEIENEKNTSN